jgi:MraZ protein
MLIGEYRHSIDAKGRISFPAKLREALGDVFVVTKGFDSCLSIYGIEQWRSLEDKVNALPMKARPFQRFLFAGAAQLSPDKQGRVLIPAQLREYAGLGEDVTIVGVSSRAEIWDTEKWQQANKQLTFEAVEDLMDELGF